MQGHEVPPLNPYEPPKAEIESAGAPLPDSELASRWQRLGAALIDGILAAIASVPMSMGRTFVRTRYNLMGNPFQRWDVSDARGMIGAALVLALMALQWYLIAKRGQTIGKIVVGTRIVMMDGRAVGFSRGVALRAWLPVAVSWIPIAGGFAALADALAIFGAQKRCLHDQIAGTKVVRVDMATAAPPV